MDRMACVDVCALALQLLLREQGFGADDAVAVVDKDTPQGVIIQVNEKAWKAGVRSGQRYATALGLTSELKAGVVGAIEIDRGVAELAELLLASSPSVEPSREQLGVFWLDASGLGLLYDDLFDWAGEARQRLREAGFVATVVAGFSRFGAYAVARSRRGTIVFPDPATEWRQARQVRIERLGVAPRVRDQLALLGVHSIGDLVGLPAAGLRQRYGAEVHRWRQFAMGDEGLPLQPMIPEAPVRATVVFDFPERNHVRLLFVIKRELHPLLARLVERAHALAALELEFHPRDAEVFTESIRPAQPTVEERILVDLVRLRLESMQLRSGVTDLVITARGVSGSPAQLALFAKMECTRDLAAADRALARVRAEFGEGAVTYAVLADGHLPEARFRFEPRSDALEAPSAGTRVEGRTSLVRRVLRKPRRLPGSETNHHPDGWLVAGVERGPVASSQGPYMVTGGWWVREVERAYHFLELESGDVLWAYWDARRRAWFQHGEVE